MNNATANSPWATKARPARLHPADYNPGGLPGSHSPTAQADPIAGGDALLRCEAERAIPDRTLIALMHCIYLIKAAMTAAERGAHSALPDILS